MFFMCYILSIPVRYIMDYDNLLLYANDCIKRLPILFCIDVSGSMNRPVGDSAKTAISELNEGLQWFFSELQADEVIGCDTEVAIVTFGEKVCIERDFSCIVHQEPPILKAFGLTPTGEAVNLSLDLIERRKKKYMENVVKWYRPWIVTITDGSPFGGSKEALSEAKSRIKNLGIKRKIYSVSALIGSQDEETVRHISELGNDKFFTVSPENLKDFFRQLLDFIYRTECF